MSRIYSDIPPGILSGIYTGIPPGMHSDIPSGILSVILFYMRSGTYLGILIRIYSYIISVFRPSLLHCLRSPGDQLESKHATAGNIPPPPQAAWTVAFTLSFLLLAPVRAATSDNIQEHDKSSQSGSLFGRVSAMMLTCSIMLR